MNLFPFSFDVEKLERRKMFQKGHLQEEGGTTPAALKPEMITVKEEYYDEIDDTPDLDCLTDMDDPLEINEKERELFLKEAKCINEDPEVVIVNRGGPGLVHQGYTYTKYYIFKQNLLIRWRCQRYRDCPGSLDTNIKCKVAKVHKEHNHPPNYVATEAAKQKCNLVGHQISNFFREDGTFIIPYKENAKKKLKARNPFGIYNTYAAQYWHPVKSQTTKSQTSK